MRVYVSGPIKGHDDFMEKFKEATEEVAEWAEAVNAAEVEPCGRFNGQCRYPGEMLDSGHTWQCFLRYDLEIMVHCDGIYMMRGWEKSKGASEELRIAQMLGMNIYFQPLLPEGESE